MTPKLKITVMLGGPSAEREVSLRSGVSVAAALRSLGHDVSEMDPKEPGWRLAPGTEVVFLSLHGTYGEDGTVQAELEKLRVPYTGCDSAASRIGFDKALTKQRCAAAGVSTARSLVLYEAGRTNADSCGLYRKRQPNSTMRASSGTDRYGAAHDPVGVPAQREGVGDLRCGQPVRGLGLGSLNR